MAVGRILQARGHRSGRASRGIRRLGVAGWLHHQCMRYSRHEYSRLLAAHERIIQAQQDYDRLRAAYLQVARTQPGHEVALALIGADVDRAHAALQALVGLRHSPHALEPSEVLRRQAAAENDDIHTVPAIV